MPDGEEACHWTSRSLLFVSFRLRSLPGPSQSRCNHACWWPQSGLSEGAHIPQPLHPSSNLEVSSGSIATLAIVSRIDNTKTPLQVLVHNTIGCVVASMGSIRAIARPESMLCLRFRETVLNEVPFPSCFGVMIIRVEGKNDTSKYDLWSWIVATISLASAGCACWTAICPAGWAARRASLFASPTFTGATCTGWRHNGAVADLANVTFLASIVILCNILIHSLLHGQIRVEVIRGYRLHIFFVTVTVNHNMRWVS